MIYLDNNATTRPDDRVVATMHRVQCEVWANPSSIHRPGQEARREIELARKHLAALIGAKPRNITICGSGTEAIDLAIRGSFLAAGRVGAKRTREPGCLITSHVEHSAVRELAAALEREEGVRTVWVDIDGDGVVRTETVVRALDANADAFLVSVQWANNETGTVNPVAEIAAACREKGVLFHTDATQWVGKMPVPEPVGDLLTYSPHKFHGPKGVGVLHARPGVRTAPLIHGEQELGRRGGTENVAGIAGAGEAARIALEWLGEPQARGRIAALRDRFEAAVLTGYPEASVNGPREPSGAEPGLRRLWNTSSIAFPRLEAEALLLLLSERGVCASAGAACSSGALEPSPVLRAMGIPPERAHGSLRFSLSRETTEDEVERGAAIVIECAGRLCESMSAMLGKRA